jgi:imidazolonepropionase-like amidohydrolase
VSRLVLRASRLIDGTGGGPIDNGAVIVEGDRIVAVERGGAAGPSGRAGETVEREFPGCTILPGLMDAHVHLVRSGGVDPSFDVRHENDYVLMLRCARNSRDLLRAGITTIRDVGAPNNTIFDFRGGAEKGIVPAPRILAAGPALTRTGGHMSYQGGSVDGPWDIRQAVRERVARGADVIKIPITGGLLVQGGRQAFTLTYTDEEIGAAVDEAHRFNRTVTVHCLGVDGIKQAHRVGVDMIEHYTHLLGADDWRWDDRLAEETMKRNLFVTTTIAAGFRAHELVTSGRTLPGMMAGSGVGSVMPAANNRFDAGVTDNGGWAFPLPAYPFAKYETRLENLRKVVESGIQLVVGTDCGASRLNAFDDGVPVEMELFVRAGMSPLRAIEAATGLNAKALGVADLVGSLAPGKYADILVVRGDPSKSISDIRAVQAVFKGGEEVYAAPGARGA